MPVLNEGRHPGEFIVSEANRSLSRDTITIASGAGIVKPGTVLGKVTASGKFVPSPATGSDGSQVGSAINIYEVDATSSDMKVAAIVRVAEVNGGELEFHASVNDDAKKAAKRAQLLAVDIVSR